MSETEQGNMVLVAAGCGKCPKNALAIVTEEQRNELERGVGGIVTCPHCNTAWRLDYVDTRYDKVAGRPTPVLVMPLYTPLLNARTPLKYLRAVPDSIDNYDEEQLGADMEQFISDQLDAAEDGKPPVAAE